VNKASTWWVVILCVVAMLTTRGVSQCPIRVDRSGSPGMNNGVNALAVLPNGDLIAGGWFATAGGTTANRIARWNGTSWSALGTGMNSSVSALAVLPNGDLIAGGNFTTAGGTTANSIARWNGTAWSAMGTGMNSSVSALAVLPDGDLIAGGSFTTADGTTANSIARWNGTAWSPMGTGMNSSVSALAVLPNGDLIAGGRFATAGGTTANRIARWNGTVWSALGTGMNDTVQALAVLDHRTIAAAWSSPSNVAVLSLTGLVSITSQPTDVSLIPGGVAAFGVQASGSDLSYRWRRNDIDLVDDARQSGAATANLTLSGVSDADQGLYSCVVTNACESRESEPAELSCRPIILQQPPDQVVLQAGAMIRVEVPPNASNLYLWRRDGLDLVNIPGLLEGVTTPALELLADDPSLLGAYDLIVTNECGRTTSATSVVVDDNPGECIGDHNQDGGVDGSDVEAFFIDWQDGLPEADVNQDGSVDGADIQAFFVAWQTGC
jgi:hypothetical protein